MIKYFVLAFHLLGVFLLSLFTDQDISISMDTPEQVKAGEEFRVSMTIVKGNIESFSRFSQELPYGLTAMRVSSANADFTFEEQRLRMIWLKLPPDDTLKVTYDIKVHERLKGSFQLKGEFAFIEGNERKTIQVSGKDQITIQPNPAIDPELIVDINDFEEVILPQIEKEKRMNKLEAIRSEPKQTGQHEIMVEITVKKNELDKFAKIEEYVPEGFRAVEGDSKDGIFSFNNGLVKILWMSLPEEQEFTINYKLIPNPGKSIADLNLSGSFSYIKEGETKDIAIKEKNYELAEVTEQEQTEEKREELPSPENEDVDADVAADEEKQEERDETEKEVEKKVEVTEIKTGQLENVAEEFILKPEDGIYYRVQLAAGHSPVDIESYFRKRNVPDEVKLEFHEGWRKYTTGSFYVYKDARDYRIKIWNETPIDDAFVSAYNEGERITVQEALLIANHKWYR